MSDQSTWCWLCSSLQRVYKWTPLSGNRRLVLDLGQNDRGSFQACIRTLSERPFNVRLEVERQDVLDIRTRRVGHVPVPHFNTDTPDAELDGLGHLPGYVPDVLYDDCEVLLVRNETESFWISVNTGGNTPPGVYTIPLRFHGDNGFEERMEVHVHVHPVLLRKREGFPVTHWFYADALCDWYGVKPFDEKFWEIVKAYMENLSSHGTNVSHTPIFTPPTDGVKRPNQLLKIRRIGEEEYEFDWTDVKKWISLAQACGMEYFEWTHFFSQWGVKHAIRIYENFDGEYDERLLWAPDTAADSDVYRRFLSQFLPEFKNFLEAEGILNKSFFHVSDEPHGEEHLANYKRARQVLRDLAPWMKVMDALSETSFAEAGLTDMPVAIITNSLEFVKKNIPRWDYFCCGPRGAFLNRLMDTPLSKIRGAGWLFYRFRSLGFLHWGYNYWYKSQTTQLIDPFTVSDGMAWPGWAYGDTFVVYPGPNGPLDSIRWEVFAESLNDYALLQAVGIDWNDPILAPFVSYEDYPKVPEWYLRTRGTILAKRACCV